ncbi:DUF4199 domain-containing protein [Aurantiacibacter sp. D1-12]|uniref:DUF4199 domain-containing protein n=1 Tax=Aurantiacibacter sp. D1-12 TaxID=2993658 RepID=UPI00237CB914|nr:DUF4199 domain-containing protein [Aurantiacibacter sp. D1-12]MDE1467943.1 DUF4199 domain-containing protein [Aurantiacibacter sp. D1-12]
MTQTRTVLTFGSISGIILAVLFLTTLSFMDTSSPDNTFGMIIGFLTMFIALSVIFVGVKRYRDQELGGVIGFWQALKLGIGMALVASLFYVLGWEAYLASTDYAFVQSAIDMGYPDYANPAYRLPITFTEILPVALVVPLVAAALLRNPRFMPAKV